MKILEGIGPKKAEALSKLGIFTLEDLLYFLPKRYEDRRTITRINNLSPGNFYSVIAEVLDTRLRPGRTEALLSDGTGKIIASWFSEKIIKFIHKGMTLVICGSIDYNLLTPRFTHPEFEILESTSQTPSITGKIFPVYHANSDVNQKSLRRIINFAVNKYASKCLHEFMPEKILKHYGMMTLPEAITNIHMPIDSRAFIRARNRLVFDELFLLQAGIIMRRQKFLSTSQAHALKPGKNFNYFMNNLPFSLTNSQKIAIDEIINDLAKDSAMNRLLQGDVGAGKTLIAFAAMLIAVDSGCQAALMAPTEILAWQHYEKLRKSLAPLGLKAAFLSGSLKISERNKILSGLSDGSINIIVGTHSIFAEKVNFSDLALVIVDEQHRFGVLQRSKLISKGTSPHVLAMTATPIPRTLIMSIYGDLEVSSLHELPPGRKRINTISFAPSEYKRVLQIIRETIARGEQIYWVCPLIDKNEEKDLSAVNTIYERLKILLPDINIAVLHGQLSPEIKSQVMQNFADNKINLLVATVVIEVGVDVPNAAAIIIQDAGNFGLAQLHQLRGRVGRGNLQSLCILLEGKNITPEGKARIAAMIKTSDGFELAEQDLLQRGPGEICGTKQHGITDFRAADLVRDEKILLLARDEAKAITSHDINLESEPSLKREIFRRLGSTLELAITS